MSKKEICLGKKRLLTEKREKNTYYQVILSSYPESLHDIWWKIKLNKKQIKMGGGENPVWIHYRDATRLWISEGKFQIKEEDTQFGLEPCDCPAEDWKHTFLEIQLLGSFQNGMA